MRTITKMRTTKVNTNRIVTLGTFQTKMKKISNTTQMRKRNSKEERSNCVHTLMRTTRKTISHMMEQMKIIKSIPSMTKKKSPTKKRRKSAFKMNSVKKPMTKKMRRLQPLKIPPGRP